MKNGFGTNDLLRVAGRHLARINGRFVKFGDHAFAVLVLLAEQALHSPGEYVTTEDLMVVIQKYQARLGALGMSWLAPTQAGVHKAVCQIRAALHKARLDDSLVELARGHGYRLNTPPGNILIDPAMRLSGGSGEAPGMHGDNQNEQKGFRGDIGRISRSQD